MIPSYDQLKEAAEIIAPYVHRTPILSSSTLNRHIHSEVWFKCENLQRMGAFKIRGATHAIMKLNEEQKARGVITHSSGNFAQAVALAASSLDIKATVVMPETAPRVKKEAVQSYGANLVECAPSLEAREKTMESIRSKSGAAFLHPSNDMNVILGQSTVAWEFIEEMEELDVLLTPVGGGGLIAGTSLVTQHLLPEAETIGSEPFGADDAYLSLKTGKIQPSINPMTIADGLKTQLGDQNFPIIMKYVSRIIRVEESEIIAAMRYIWERMKIIIEPSSAVAVAALFRNKGEFKNRRVGVILTGGNVDLGNLPFT